MTKFIRWIQNYLLYALPLVLTCMAWATFQSEKDISNNSAFLMRAAWELLSWNLMLWFAVLILFLILIVALPEAREKTIKRLANIKERDEREELITGRASRSAYISTLSLMILLLFFSIFTLKIYRVPEKEAINGKTGILSIGFNFGLLDKPRVETNSENKILFESKDIPLSKTAIILILVIWQLGVFNFMARKENMQAS